SKRAKRIPKGRHCESRYRHPAIRLRGDPMRRREFITLLGGAAAWPLAARAQQSAKMLRVGALSAQPRTAPIWLAFEQRMAELGYKRGANFAFEFVPVAGMEDYERGYRELAARRVDIMLSAGPEIALKSARAAAQMLPTVMLAIDYVPIARAPSDDALKRSLWRYGRVSPRMGRRAIFKNISADGRLRYLCVS